MGDYKESLIKAEEQVCEMVREEGNTLSLSIENEEFVIKIDTGDHELRASSDLSLCTAINDLHSQWMLIDGN